MYDKGKIIIGLVIFLAVFTIPFWYSQVTGDADVEPQPDTTALLADPEKDQCVESANYMAAKHMDLLNEWRLNVVRDGETTYTSEEYGTQFDMSLTDTCLKQCHTNKSEFCDTCHNYVAVDPDCWDCHNIVEGE